MEEDKNIAFRLDQEERIRIKSWFETWAYREGENVVWIEGMDNALIGKSQVWRVNRWIWVPTYQYELIIDQYLADNPDATDILDEVNEKYVDKYYGHMTPVINFGCIREPIKQDDPFMDEMNYEEEEEEVDE